MPFFGLGLHVLIALFFAVHALRSGQQIYWLIILFSFPLLGSIVYFLVIFLPNSKLEHGTRKVMAAAAKSLDPTKELRESRAAFEYTPTAQNQMRLASALLESGQAEDAAINYEACLKGPFASDPEIKYRAARAFVESKRFEMAIVHLEAIHQTKPDFRPDQVSLLLARAFAGANQYENAKKEFEYAASHFGGFEIKAEYAIWAASSGDHDTVNRLKAELTQTMSRWTRHTRELNASIVSRLNVAIGNTNN